MPNLWDIFAPFRLPRRSHRWRLRSRKCLLSSLCNQPLTSRAFVSCSNPVRVEASWLWCLEWKSSSNFPKHPSAFSHPEYSSEVVHPDKTRSSRELCSPTVPTLGTLCVSNRVVCHLLHPDSSNIRLCVSKRVVCHLHLVRPTCVVVSVKLLCRKRASHSSVIGFSGSRGSPFKLCQLQRFSTLALWYHVKVTCGSSREPNTENKGLMESLDLQSTRERESKPQNSIQNSNTQCVHSVCSMNNFIQVLYGMTKYSQYFNAH